MISRRKLMISGAAALAGAPLAAGPSLLGALSSTAPATGPTTGPVPYKPVVTPNGATLPFTLDNGVKVFHLGAEPVKREFAPGMIVDCWGYNGLTPGPTIEAIEGDRVRLFVTNKLPEPTTVHWHGLIVPNGMDGVTGLTQPHIAPGETFVYEFTLRQNGTYMYHPHSDEMTQMALGMQGFFVIHPKNPAPDYYADRDFCIFLQEWFISPGTSRPNPMIMTDFNLFTFNSRVWPGTDALVAKLNDRVRIRYANLSMDNHPIHFHGHRGWITGTDGGRIPASARMPAVTVDVPPGSTRDLEFVADNSGDWPVHCHKNHHAMNAMSHDVPNVIGMDGAGVTRRIDGLVPGYMSMGEKGMGGMTEMRMPLPKNTLPMMTGTGPFGVGGMFTILKVREGITGYEDPGWYKQPEGTGARKVSS